MLVNRSESYSRVAFDNEAELEQVVQDFAEHLFGPNILYLPQTRISTIGGRGSIPDAIVIDVGTDEWYIVEAERAVHGTWEHIAPQVSRQLAAVASPRTRDVILRTAMDKVGTDPTVKEVFVELGVPELEIHGRLHAILQRPPVIAIPIDSIPKDLKEWVQTLRNDAKIWVIEKYVHSDDPERMLYSIPDDALPTLETRATATGSVSTVTRSSAPWQDLLDAGLVKDGDELRMEYGPRGQPRQQFRGIARNDGIEVDGQTFSPSYAAVRCIQQAGSHRKTANGWTVWKTARGTLINELYQQLSSDTLESAEDGDPVEPGDSSVM